jgi:hypothetical protein
MNWTLTTPFVASINFHEGALVANYPCVPALGTLGCCWVTLYILLG